MTASTPVPIQTEPGIDEYLRKRLMPVEGARPEPTCTGTLFQQDAWAEIFSNISTFGSVTTSNAAGRVTVSSEISMHFLIYKLRPDVRGIVHADPCTATGLLPQAWH